MRNWKSGIIAFAMFAAFASGVVAQTAFDVRVEDVVTLRDGSQFRVSGILQTRYPLTREQARRISDIAHEARPVDETTNSGLPHPVAFVEDLAGYPRPTNDPIMTSRGIIWNW